MVERLGRQTMFSLLQSILTIVVERLGSRILLWLNNLASMLCFRCCSRFLLWLHHLADNFCSRFCGRYFGFQPASGIKILGYCDTECRRPVLRPLVHKPAVNGQVDAEAGFAHYISDTEFRLSAFRGGRPTPGGAKRRPAWGFRSER